MVLQILLSALALVLVLEGFLPFLSPTLWRRFIARMTDSSNRSIRIMGFISLSLGTILMILVHSRII